MQRCAPTAVTVACLSSRFKHEGCVFALLVSLVCCSVPPRGNHLDSMEQRQRSAVEKNGAAGSRGSRNVPRFADDVLPRLWLYPTINHLTENDNFAFTTDKFRDISTQIYSQVEANNSSYVLLKRDDFFLFTLFDIYIYIHI